MNPYLSLLGYQGPNILLILILVAVYHGHGPAYHGPAYHGPAYHGPAYHGPAYHGPAYHQHQHTLYAAVLLWQYSSHLINVAIKNYYKAPRPNSRLPLKEKVTLKNFMTIHRNFGMPSGHAQAMWSQLVFIALYFRSPLLTTFAALQTALTLTQRFLTGKHSLLQLTAGSLLGIGIGLIFYIMTKGM
jgi:membrane-associated phospholipid phosphatase